MDLSFSGIMAGFVFGVLGVYLIKRGKREAHMLSAVFGIVLIIYPYFVENHYLLWGIGFGILFLAYRFKD